MSLSHLSEILDNILSELEAMDRELRTLRSIRRQMETLQRDIDRAVAEIESLDDVLLAHETPEDWLHNSNNSNIVDATSVVEKMTNAMVNADADVCSICSEGFQGGSSGTATPKQPPCGHVYHQVCLATWLSRSESCPLCRRIIRTIDV
ncbi:hypothetical protein ACLB2K_005266 [Fragaria x ananassa]